jgi:hypothetical protein
MPAGRRGLGCRLRLVEGHTGRLGDQLCVSIYLSGQQHGSTLTTTLLFNAGGGLISLYWILFLWI